MTAQITGQWQEYQSTEQVHVVVAFYTYFWKVPSLNLSHAADCPNTFSGISVVPPKKMLGHTFK